ncbi:hypothetical protein BHE74_00059254, partial [Ensete ventricosum]
VIALEQVLSSSSIVTYCNPPQTAPPLRGLPQPPHLCRHPTATDQPSSATSRDLVKQSPSSATPTHPHPLTLAPWPTQPPVPTPLAIDRKSHRSRAR